MERILERPPALSPAGADGALRAGPVASCREDAPLAPERDAALLATHRLGDPLEVQAWLRVLRERSVRLALFPRLAPLRAAAGAAPEGAATFARLLAVHSPIDHVALGPESMGACSPADGPAGDAADARASRPARAGAAWGDWSRGAIVVARVDGVKLQFEIGPLVEDSEHGLPCLRGKLPSAIHRLQRRDAYRARPPAPRAARCLLRAADPAAAEHPVVDLSAGGLALRLPADAFDRAPAAGTRWPDAMVVLPGVAALRCALELAHAEPPCPAEPSWRLGVRFVDLADDQERDIQRYVIAAQRRAR